MANKEITDFTKATSNNNNDEFLFQLESAGAYRKITKSDLFSSYSLTTHTHTASDVTDFDTEVSNNTSVAANTTHISSDGTNHSHVVLNDTHRGLTSGNPHHVSLSDVGGTTDHTALSNIGTNTHAQIDTHIANSSNPHSVIASQVNVTDSDDYFTGTNTETIFAEIGETEFTNGYDLETSASLPDIAFDNGTRTFTTSVKGGSSNYYFWCNGKKITKTGDATVVIPDISDTYYIYFDNSGVLKYVAASSVSNTQFYENAITGLVYWNKTAGTGMTGNELHGIRMSASTHQYNHDTYGARYEDGLDIEGLSSGGTTYTQTTSGHFWDEDIRHSISAQSTHKFLYKLGSGGEWTGTSADANVCFKNAGSYGVWNENNSGTWQLTQGTSSTDFVIYFFLATPNISSYTVYKLIGQNAYSNRSNARAAIETEMRNITTDGLPSPEFVFLYAIIVKRNGTLQALADGSLYYDLRYVKGGSGGNSNAASYASDIITDTSNFSGHLSTADTNVQLALDTLDDHTHTISQVTDVTATSSELNILDGATLTTTEINYVDGVTSSIQTQIDAKGTMNDVIDDTSPQLGGNLDGGAHDISVNAGQKIIFDGSGGDTYLKYNSTSHKVELYVDNVKKAEWG